MGRRGKVFEISRSAVGAAGAVPTAGAVGAAGAVGLSRKGQWVSGPHSEYFIHSKLFLDLHLLVPCTINYRKRAEQDGERGEDET